MRTLALLVTSFLFLSNAFAGETRLGGGITAGSLSLDDGRDEITADTEALILGVTHYTAETGVFFGASLGQLEADNFELNGSSLGPGTLEADTRTFEIGYRSGKLGEAQWIFAAAFQQIDPEDGDSSNSTILSFGMERDLGGGRVSVIGNYEKADDSDSLGIGFNGTYYLTDVFGLVFVAGASAGETDDSVDTRSASIGVGVELRFKN